MSHKNKNNFNAGKEDDFSLPENYFESFSNRLFKKIDADNELKEYPILSSLQKENGFIVPATYFEDKEELLAYPTLFEHKKNNFSVPTIYFETLSNNIINKIEIEEEKEQFTYLYSLRESTAFDVPTNYFENFIINEPVKIISLYKRIKLSYKLAAAVALFLCVGILLTKYQRSVVETNDCHTFACLSKQDILNSGYVLHVSDDNIIDLIDEKNLSDSLLLKQNGKTEKITIDDISDNVDINTLTDNL